MKSSPDNTVEEILKKAFMYGYEIGKLNKSFTIQNVDYSPNAEVTALDSHYLSIFLEIVGADEKESCSQNCDGETCCDHEAWIKEGRNAPRQELRTALQDRLGGKNE